LCTFKFVGNRRHIVGDFVDNRNMKQFHVVDNDMLQIVHEFPDYIKIFLDHIQLMFKIVVKGFTHTQNLRRKFGVVLAHFLFDKLFNEFALGLVIRILHFG